MKRFDWREATKGAAMSVAAGIAFMVMDPSVRAEPWSTGTYYRTLIFAAWMFVVILGLSYRKAHASPN